MSYDLPADPEEATAQLEADYQAAHAEPQRLAIPARAGTELAARYRASRAAEARLADFLAGVIAALDLDPARVAGYDDDTGDLLLVPEVPLDD